MRALTYFTMLTALLAWMGCGGNADGETGGRIFPVVDTNFQATTLIVPKVGYEYKVLFQAGDQVFAPNGELTPAKARHDFLAFLPIEGDPRHALLWTNHESEVADPLLGDGGGATLLEIYRDSLEGWKVIGHPQAVDFSPVGGTIANCLGAVTPWGTVLTSEEVEPENNLYFFEDSLNPILTDTTPVALPDSNGRTIPRWMNCGWMVEVDPYERKALRKLYAMGRMMHEGNYCMPDQKTVYLMDDNGPAAFFKFVADKAGDYSAGQLYAFQLSESGGRNKWLPLPRSVDSLAYSRDMAFKRGATIFIRFEDIELAENGLFYITETGKDSVSLAKAIALGGKVAPWLKDRACGEGRYDDPHGRLLTFDPKTDALRVLLEGGQAEKDKGLHFSNPDNLAMDTKRNLLVIHEDINGADKGRLPEGARHWVNEIYTLDLNITQPKLDDLKRLAVIPHGGESTGGVWSSDFSSLFFNVQHPSDDNPPPFDRASTIVLTGWPE